MTVGKLKKLLEGYLETLEDFEADQEIELQGNTYFTRNNNYVLQTPKGFLGLDNLEDAIGDNCPDCGKALEDCICDENTEAEGVPA